jgi:hypothetical protein
VYKYKKSGELRCGDALAREARHASLLKKLLVWGFKKNCKTLGEPYEG